MCVKLCVALKIITVYNKQSKLNKILAHSFEELKYSYRISNDKPNACILVLLRNQNLDRFIQTMNKFEQNFNNRYNYPYVLFNDVEFDDTFKNKIKQIYKFVNIIR